MLFSILWLEVMDKEWPLSWVLLVFLGGGAVGYSVARKWRWSAIIFSLLLALIGLSRLMELWDPFVGPMIKEEAGTGYFIWNYISIVSGTALPILGALSRKKPPEKEEARQNV